MWYKCQSRALRVKVQLHVDEFLFFALRPSMTQFCVLCHSSRGIHLCGNNPVAEFLDLLCFLFTKRFAFICRVFAEALVQNLFKVLVSRVFVHTTVVAVVRCQGITANFLQAFACTSLFLPFEFLSFSMFLRGHVHLLKVDAHNARCEPVSFTTKLGPCSLYLQLVHCAQPSPHRSKPTPLRYRHCSRDRPQGSMHQSELKMCLSVSPFTSSYQSYTASPVQSFAATS